MVSIDKTEITLNDVYSKKANKCEDVVLKYGTAGFRTKSDLLSHVMYRMGILAALRSKCLNGKSIGLMITASHNPECDNGVKLVDPKGEMLASEWEIHATSLANTSDDTLIQSINDIVIGESIDMSIRGSVFIGRDTRKSSPDLSHAAIHGVESVVGGGVLARDFGIISTPILHYLIRAQNTDGVYGQVSVEGYYNKLVDAFLHVKSMDRCEENVKKSPNGDVDFVSSYTPTIHVDCANGVAAHQFQENSPIFKKLKNELNIVTYNHNYESGRLNERCGADHVKVSQSCPIGMKELDLQSTECEIKCCSYDGDADRIVYFYFNESGKFILLDGDRIATLVTKYLMTLLRKCEMTELKIGLVQTAYANGNSTKYITETLKVPVECVPTGVKHLHACAHSKYDVGIYFEANGHGTVVFSEVARKLIKLVHEEEVSKGSERSIHTTRLLASINLINETVGDALSDMLLVETALHYFDMSVSDWYQSTYVDLPSLQLKVSVRDRSMIETCDAERKVSKPDGMQSQIDAVVKKFNEKEGDASARAFVRPSGTEDVVRIYTECDTPEKVKQLADEVTEIVSKYLS